MHRLKARLVHLDARLAVLLECIRLGKAHRTDRRVRKDDGWDPVVLEARAWLAAVQAVAQPATGGDGDRRELVPRRRHVAQRVDARHVCALVLIDGDEAAVAQLDARVLEAHAREDGAAASGVEHDVDAGKHGSVLERHFVRPVLRQLDRAELGLAAHRNSLALHLRVEHVLHHRVEAVTQHLLAAADERRVRAQFVHDER
mmetsp:Transcript_4687/g.14479  ORF Transcript_4687/g.14479 Transcript_4687/m.14479 type:complete len:201 (-) Transcript_4687:632-1234(-)